MIATETTFKELLRLAQGERSLNQYALNAGISSAMLSMLKRGDRKPSPELLKRLAAHAENGVTYLDLMTAAGFLSNNKEASWANNIKPIQKRLFTLIESNNSGEPMKKTKKQITLVEGGLDADLCVIATGDDMAGARINSGDLVFISSSERIESGDIVAVIMQNEAKLYRIHFFKEQNSLTLTAENQNSTSILFKDKDAENLQILGKAIAFQSNL